MFYIYILHSESANKYYIGYTEDTLRRLNEHNTSRHNTYTSKYRPWSISAVFAVSEKRSESMLCEQKLKKLKSRKVIIELIKHNGDVEFLFKFL